jgi:O-antigen ligase
MNGDPSGDRLASVLAEIRRNGVWALAGVATLSSVNIVALAAGPERALSATRLAPGDIVLASLALAGLLEVVLYRRPWRRAVPPAAAFVLVAASALAAGVSLVTGREEPLSGLAGPCARELAQLAEVFLVGFGWSLWAPAGRRDLDRAVLALAGAVTVNVLMALGQLGSGAEPFHVRGLFPHRNALGVFLAVALPVLVAAASSPSVRPRAGPPPYQRVWFLITTAVGLALITSAGLFAAAVVGVLVAAFAVGARAGLAALAATAVIALVIQPVGLERVRRAQLDSVRLFPEDAQGRRSPSARLRRWAAVLEAARASPVTGFGPGLFQRRIEVFYLPGFEKRGGSRADVSGYDVTFDEPGSQCLYEVTLFETGVLGMLALLGFLATSLARGAHAAARDRSGLAAGSLGSAAGVLVAGVFAAVLVQGVALPFVMVLAFGARSRDFPAERMA